MEVWPFVDKGVCNMIKVRGREGSVGGAGLGQPHVGHSWHVSVSQPVIMPLSQATA